MKKYPLLLLAVLVSVITTAQNTGNIYRILSYPSTGNSKAITADISGQNGSVDMKDLNEEDTCQIWAFIAKDGIDNGFSLLNLKTFQNIDMASKADPAYKVLQWTPEFSNENQNFIIHSPGIAGSAIQLLKANNQDRVLTIHSDNSLWMDNDKSKDSTYFELQELMDYRDVTFPLPYVTYNLVSTYAGTVISNRKDGSDNATLYCDEMEEGNTGQQWQFRVSPNLGFRSTTYQLMNPLSGKCIDAALGNSNVTLLQWTAADNYNNNQFWHIRAVPDSVNVYQFFVEEDGKQYYIAARSSGTAYRTTISGKPTYFRLKAVDTSAIPQRPNWQNETVFEENKEVGHATYIPYQSTEAMQNDERYQKAWLDPTESSRFMTLDGTWKLKWGEVPETLILPGEEVYGDNVDASSWNDIKVPGCLEMQGYGTPYYVNVDYPFTDNPPYIKMKSGIKNTVASYRRSFTLPEGWDKQRTLLHFDGAYSCLYIYVNGQYVGYSEGSNNDAEFDVTKYVRSGSNNVTVQVIRFTDASYLEDQDMWRMSGLHRDVYMVSVPKTFVRDHIITTDLNDNATAGTLNIGLTLDNRDSLEVEKQYEVRLLSPDGAKIAGDTQSVAFTKDDASKALTFSFSDLADLKPWTADSPTLYTVEVSQKDKEGTEEEVFSTKYGFVKVKISGVKFMVNGRRTFLKGVNTQDTHPTDGRTMSIETMWKDLTMMKQANVNSVRTSHYPRQPKMLAMMDYLGLYQMDEADVEFHKNWSDKGTIVSDTKWKAPIVDREVRMVQRDRNHPSVVIWSMGNESSDGSNFTAAYQAIRELDSRPIHYEGTTNQGSWTGNSDINSYMYRDVSTMQSNCSNSTRPVYMCEYAHAMGNSVGNLQEYWDVFEASNSSMGGAIWDWVDQAIYSPADIKNSNFTTNGFNRWRNGNDYPVIGQGNFVNNGIITADRQWTGKLDEVKRVYQYVKFNNTIINKKIYMTDAYETNTLEGYILQYTVLRDGIQVETGTVTLPKFTVGVQKAIEIPYTTEPDGGSSEYLLNISVLTPSSTPWCGEGYVIASKQYTLQERGKLPVITEQGTPLTYENGEISNDKVDIKVNTTGSLTEQGVTKICLDGVEVISEGSVPDHYNYRWIENDAPYGTDPSYSTDNGITAKTVSVTLADDGQTCTIKQIGTGAWTNYVYVYTVYANGIIDLNATYRPQSATTSARRLGIGMQLNNELINTTYYARGPRSNTIDRKTGSNIGIYTLPVKQYHVEYVKPQTSADRQDLRYIVLYDADGNGVKIDTEGQVNFSLDNYDDAYMHNIKHQWEMTPSEDIYAHFDYMQKGIGNGSCGAGVLDKYHIPTSGTYTYTLRFTPVSKYEPTGIIEVAPENKTSVNSTLPHDQPVFTISGHLIGNTSCLSALPSGTYITKGHKFTIK